MISQQAFQKATQAAWRDGKLFLEEYADPEDFFNQTRDGYDKTIINLFTFIFAQTEIENHDLKGLPKPARGYASWLLKVANGRGGIALFDRQIVNWYEMYRMPPDVQKIRSILHELGHIQLSPRLLDHGLINPPNTPKDYSDAATPEEEELAWVYSVTFLGLILGAYSVKSRKRVESCDDAPRFFI